MAKFRCNGGNYLFEREFIIKICPNCGEEEKIDIEQSADELLKDI